MRCSGCLSSHLGAGGSQRILVRPYQTIGIGTMAEREGFEPPVPFRVRRFSRPEPSTTRPPLREFSLPHARRWRICGFPDWDLGV